MTREHRKIKIEDDFAFLAISDTYSLIDQIYDDFESRVCENCEYNDKEWRGCDLLQGTPPVDFGCNQFERKTDGDV